MPLAQILLPRRGFIYHMKHFFHLKWQNFCHLQMEKNNLERLEKLEFFNIKTGFFSHLSQSEWHFWYIFGQNDSNNLLVKQIKVYLKLKNYRIWWDSNWDEKKHVKLCCQRMRNFISIMRKSDANVFQVRAHLYFKNERGLQVIQSSADS